MPQYVLRQIQTFSGEFEIYVIEVNNYSNDFVVQRKKIAKLAKLIQLQGDSLRLPSIIEEIKPDVIHFQEIPESFINVEILKTLYDRWPIVITSHSSLTRRKDFVLLPDRFVTVNRWQKMLFEQEFPEVVIDMWEYPIEDKKLKIDYSSTGPIPDLLPNPGIDIRNDYNILNVGLFTPGKNQGELFDIASRNPNKKYHFVGNQAENFRSYWEPLMKVRPANCIIWGERDDVDSFYQYCQELYFTSKFELNPLVVKEALSHGMKVRMYKLPTYLDDYDDNKLVTFL